MDQRGAIRASEIKVFGMLTFVLATTIMFGLFFGVCSWIARIEARNYELRYAELDRTFEDRFPPLSDAEFVARCRPGTRPEIALKVRRIVADCLGVEYERIYPESRFVDDLGADR